MIKNSWYQAQKLNDSHSNYCTVATVSRHGTPSARVVILRQITEEGLVVFCSAISPKWDELISTGEYELLLFWETLMVQYRIGGSFDTISEEEMEKHWSNKQYNSKIMDHYYNTYQPQSSVIQSRELFLQRINTLQKQYSDEKTVPFPQGVKGILFKPEYVEQWIGSDDRLHERYLFRKVNGKWEREILIP